MDARLLVGRKIVGWELVERMESVLGDVISQNPVKTGLVAALSASTVATQILFPLQFVAGIDNNMKGDTSDASWRFALFAILLSLSQILPLLQTKLLIPAGTALGARLTTEAAESFYHQSEHGVDPTKGQTHPLVNEMGGNNQPQGVSYGLLQVLVNILTGVLGAFAINGYMWSRIGNVASLSFAQILVSLPVGAISSKFVGEAVSDAIDYLYKAFTHTIVYSNDYVPNKLFNRETFALNRFNNFLVNDLNPRTEKSLQTNANVLMVQPVLGVAVFVAQLVWAAQKNLLTQDEFILLMFYAMTITQVLWNLMRQVIEGLPSIALFVSDLQYTSQGLMPSTEVLNIAPDAAGIEFDNVTYTPPRRPEPALRNVSFTIEPRAVIELTGNNGTGKTTLLRMLLRFISPDEGKVHFGSGKDAKDVTKLNDTSIRAACAIVSQEPTLVEGTFKENIIRSYPEALDAQISEVMEVVGLEFKLTDFIEFRHKGALLSGGEQERVALAGALLALCYNEKIRFFLWDEGIGGLHLKGKDNILTHFANAIREKQITSIIVTHDSENMRKFIPFTGIIDMNRFTKKEKEEVNVITATAERPPPDKNTGMLKIERAVASITIAPNSAMFKTDVRLAVIEKVSKQINRDGDDVKNTNTGTPQRKQSRSGLGNSG